MGNAARKILEEFDALPEVDKQAVVLELLRRAVAAGYAFPDDSGLVRAADQVFAELDQSPFRTHTYCARLVATPPRSSLR